MIPLTILVCTLGIPAILGPNHEHCYFYNVEIHLAPAEVPAKIVEFCDIVRATAKQHGGSITRCEVAVEPKPEPRPERGIKA